MRKLLAFSFLVLFVLPLVACGSGDDNDENGSSESKSCAACTVTFKDDIGTYYMVTVQNGTPIGIRMPPEPIGDKMFRMWNTDPNANGEALDDTTIIMSNLTVYSIWWADPNSGGEGCL